MRCKIHCIMNRLRGKNTPKLFTCSTLYNDFLIVDTILDSVPEHIFESLHKELATFDEKLRSLITLLNSEDVLGSLTIKPIADILKTVESKDTLLQDFLVCGGYY